MCIFWLIVVYYAFFVGIDDTKSRILYNDDKLLQNYTVIHLRQQYSGSGLLFQGRKLEGRSNNENTTEGPVNWLVTLGTRVVRAAAKSVPPHAARN